jgi:hypothetical protein
MSDLEKIRSIGDIEDNDFLTKTLDITWPAERRRGGHGKGAGHAVRRAESRAWRLQHHHPVRPQIGRTGSRSRRLLATAACTTT